VSAAPREEAVAAVLRALPADLAERVLARLSPGVATRLRSRIRSAPASAPAGQIDDALREIADVQRIADRPPPVVGPNDDPVKALRAAAPDRLVAALLGEQPRTIAVVLSCLDQTAAADLLKRLPPAVRPKVALLLGRPAPPNPDLLGRLARAVLDRCRAGAAPAPPPTADDRARRVAAMLRALDRTERLAALKRLEETDPDTAAKVAQHLYQFEDLLRVEGRQLQLILGETDLKTLAMALQDAPQPLTAKVFANLSTRARETVAEESSLMGTLPKAKVEAARAGILAVLRRLEEEGTLSLDG